MIVLGPEPGIPKSFTTPPLSFLAEGAVSKQQLNGQESPGVLIAGQRILTSKARFWKKLSWTTQLRPEDLHEASILLTESKMVTTSVQQAQT